MILSSIVALIPLTATAASPNAEDPEIIEYVRGLRQGRPATRLEQALENMIQAAYMQDGEGGGGGEGFKEEEVPTLDAPSTEEARYEAFVEYVGKSTPLEAVKAGLYFLASNPDNPNNSSVTSVVNQKANELSEKEQADLREFIAFRKSLEGEAPKAKAKQLTKWAEGGSSAFADSAQREAEFHQSVVTSQKEERGDRRGRLLVRVGVVLLVIALVGVVLVAGGL
jgi:hypothetical protein